VKFEKSQNRVRKCRKLARLAARQTAAAAEAMNLDGEGRGRTSSTPAAQLRKI